MRQCADVRGRTVSRPIILAISGGVLPQHDNMIMYGVLNPSDKEEYHQLRVLSTLYFAVLLAKELQI